MVNGQQLSGQGMRWPAAGLAGMRRQQAEVHCVCFLWLACRTALTAPFRHFPPALPLALQCCAGAW